LLSVKLFFSAFWTLSYSMQGFFLKNTFSFGKRKIFYRESLRRALQWNVREEAIFAEKNSGFCVFIGFTFIQFV
jgi:hypothetical protein